MQYNISPEKMIGVKAQGISVNKMLQQKDALDYLETEVYNYALMTHMFKTDSQSISYKLMEKMYNG